jgi:DeoR/GlpR family transcriptional regulator of sugar metabolism
VRGVADELDVATEAIRRDLEVIAGRRLLERVHGSAVRLETAAFESAIEYTAPIWSPARCACGARAGRVRGGVRGGYCAG